MVHEIPQLVVPTNVSKFDLLTIIMTYHARCAHKDNESGIQTAPTFE